MGAKRCSRSCSCAPLSQVSAAFRRGSRALCASACLRAGKPRRQRVPGGAPAVLAPLQLRLRRSPDGGDGRDEGLRGALKVGGHLDHVVALRRRSPDRPAGERLVGVDTDLGGLAQHGWGRGDQLARFTQQLLSALMDGLDRGGLRLQLLDARVGLELPLIRDDTGRAAHGTVRSFVSGPVDLECLSEQGRRLAGERGVGAPQPLQVVAHVAELAHRGVHPLAGYDGEGAQLPQTGQGAPLLDRDRVGRESAFHRREVPGFLAECLGDAAGALVVQAVELRQELRGLRLLVSDLALGVEPGLAEQGLGRRDLAETEDLRQGVVQLGGAPLQDPSQLVVGEKRWPALQGSAPAVLLQVAPLAVDGEGGAGDVGFVRPAALDGHGRAPAVGPEPAGDAGWSVVEVAPAVLPDLGALGPAPVGAGEQHLEGLGEGGLARAVAPHHEGQAGEGSRLSVTGGPMPRKPSTSMEAR